MQILIVILLTLGAAFYLLIKWLPTSSKRWLFARLGWDQTRLAPLRSTGGCGDGCASCHSCDDAPLPASGTTDDKIKHRIIPIRAR